MPPRQSVPLIHLDLLDSPPHSLSPSSTFDIKDILSQVKLLPRLLAEHFALDDADDALYLDDGYWQDVPPFPIGRRPPLFILISHRTRLPFPIRPEAIELGHICWDEEDVRPLLTTPTAPRMKLMIREQLYVQKWVDTLMSDDPPRHIPWTCEEPATKRNWTAEGSIFPAAVIKYSTEVAHSGELFASSETSALVQSSTESHTSTSHVPVRLMDLDPRIFGEELNTSSSLPYIGRTLPTPSESPPSLVPSGSLIVTTPNTPDAPLATRRGKSLSGLKLKTSVIQQLEYPDIPTAFRGSSSGWPSSQSDVFPVPSFTDHQSMLLDLRSKCAALGNGMSAYIQESPCPQTHGLLSAEEWAFTRGCATLDSIPESTHGQVSGEIIADTRISFTDNSSTPAKGQSVVARLGFVPRLPSTHAQSSVNRSSDPPCVPLPPRPALIHPSTPPYVRGILKKVKSVRFEDVITNEFSDLTSSAESPPLKRPSPPVFGVSSERPCTLISNPPAGGRASFKEIPVLGKSAQEKRPTPRSLLPHKANGKLEPVHLNAGKASKPTSAATSAERPCRIAHARENTNLPPAPQARAKQKEMTISETDVRRGIEGPTKSRLSTPLRNIFRFK